MTFNAWATEANILAIYAREQIESSDRATVLSNTLRACGKIGYGDANPANQCMDWFLKAKELPTEGCWEFDLSTLFAEDSTVRSRVYSEVIRRTIGALTQTEQLKSFISGSKPSHHHFGNIPGQGVLRPSEIGKAVEAQIDPIITIFQKNFSSPGWWGALGTFPLRWKRLSEDNANGRVSVVLSGENWYDWHPDDDKRSTQRLHEWAKKLIKLGAASPFNMKAKPLTLVVDTQNAKIDDVNFINTGFQLNPAVSKGKGMAGRVIQYYRDR